MARNIDRRPQTIASGQRSAVSGQWSVLRPSSLVFAALLVAFFLRAYRLADQNVWWDEGWSIWLSQKDVAWIAWRTAMDEHPPLHYWMLHFWNFVAGTSAFAGRFLSLAFGVLTIALIYRIGKRVGGAWIGALAALFLATARFHIWWSQDIKNYTPSIFFAFAALWFALKVSSFKFQVQSSEDRPSQFAIRNSLAYALCAALALWTHYLAALVLIALNIYALFATLYASRFSFQFSVFSFQRSAVSGQPSVFRPSSFVLRHWLIANLLAAALFAPWFYLYLQNAAEWTAAPTFDFALFLKLVATVLPLGITTHIDNYAGVTMVFTLIAALPVLSILFSVFRQKRQDPEHRILNTEYWTLFTLIVALPPLLVYALSLTPVSFFAPKIQARYLLVLLPAYVMLLAFGVAFLARLSRPFAAFVILIVLGANAFVLNDYYAARRLRDEYATLANTINAFARQGDLVLLNTDQEWPTLLYYLRAPLDWLGVPNGKAMTPSDADALARRALTRHDAIWIVTIPDALATDPERLLEKRFISRRFVQRFDQTFDDKRLAFLTAEPRDLFSVPRENFAPQFSRGQRIGADLTLVGFDLPLRQVRPGDTVRIVTYWDVTATSAITLEFGDINMITSHTPSGERIRLQTNFVIPPDFLGDLPIRVNGVEIAHVSVEPLARVAYTGKIANRVDYRLGDAIHLVGFDLPTQTLNPGETLRLTLYWRAERPLEKSYTVFAQLVGAFNPRKHNPLWGQVDRAPSPPSNAWLPNEIVAETYRIVVDADAPAGMYTLIVGMYDAATGARLMVGGGGDRITIGEIQVR